MLCRLLTGMAWEEWRALQRSVFVFEHRLKELSTKQSTGSSAALLVRINELEAALEQLQKSNRRELGKLWKLVGQPDDLSPLKATDRARFDRDLERFDAELAAELALQSAPAAAPGKE